MKVQQEPLHDERKGLIAIEGHVKSPKQVHVLDWLIVEGGTLMVGQHASNRYMQKMQVDVVLGQVSILVAENIQH